MVAVWFLAASRRANSQLIATRPAVSLVMMTMLLKPLSSRNVLVCDR